MVRLVVQGEGGEEGEEDEDDGDEDEVPFDEEADVEDAEELGGAGMRVHDMHLGDAAPPAAAAAPDSTPPPAAEERPPSRRAARLLAFCLVHETLSFGTGQALCYNRLPSDMFTTCSSKNFLFSVGFLQKFTKKSFSLARFAFRE